MVQNLRFKIMSNTEVIVLTATFIFVGFRIYQKYFRKDSLNKKYSGSAGKDSASSSHDDDYEPYSGKKQ
jgi:hypothetical protein